MRFRSRPASEADSHWVTEYEVLASERSFFEALDSLDEFLAGAFGFLGFR
jgi:hypothetical protein